MSDDHKKPGVAFWATAVVVVVLVAYPLIFGPACWLVNRDMLPEPFFKSVFAPCAFVPYSLPESVVSVWGFTCGGIDEINAAVMLFAASRP